MQINKQDTPWIYFIHPKTNAVVPYPYSLESPDA